MDSRPCPRLLTVLSQLDPVNCKNRFWAAARSGLGFGIERDWSSATEPKTAGRLNIQPTGCEAMGPDRWGYNHQHVEWRTSRV